VWRKETAENHQQKGYPRRIQSKAEGAGQDTAKNHQQSGYSTGIQSIKEGSNRKLLQNNKYRELATKLKITWHLTEEEIAITLRSRHKTVRGSDVMTMGDRTETVAKVRTGIVH